MVSSAFKPVRICSTSLALCSFTALAATASAAPATEGTELGEVVVTAQKREQRLQDVPFAVSALTADDLTERSAQDFTDYARAIPGLSFTDLGSGRQKPAVRGINVNIGDPTVGFYIDDMPIPASGGTIRLTSINPVLVDIDRIEVLRGPQGTLYGSGSMGGTVKLIMHQPDATSTTGEVRADLESVDGGSSGESVQGIINTPLIHDVLALRASAWLREGGAFIDRRDGAGHVQRVPDEHTSGERVALQYEPGDTVRVLASAFRQRQRFDGFQSVTYGDSNASGALAQNFLFDVGEPNENDFSIYNLTLEAGGDQLDFVSSTTQHDNDYRATEETGELLQVFLGEGLASSITESSGASGWTQEFRLSSHRSTDVPSAGGPTLAWVLGAFYDDLRTHGHTRWSVPGSTAEFNDNLFSLDQGGRTHQKAVFGELTLDLPHALQLTGGVRRYKVTKSFDALSDGAFNGGRTVSDLPSDASGNVYKGNLSWQPSHHLHLYAQAAQGFRPGFGLAVLPGACVADALAVGLPVDATQVRPDGLWNYELGAKTLTREGQLLINMALYQINDRDIQLSSLLPCGFPRPGNAGDARSRGVEIESTWHASEPLSLGANASYTHAQFTRIAPGNAAQPGDPILDVPRWQAAAFAQLDHHYSSGVIGRLRLDADYTASSLMFFERDAASAPAPLRFREKPAQVILGARAEFEFRRLTFALYGRNLTNAVDPIGFNEPLSLNLPQRPRFTVNRPRTLGISAVARF